jgi:hypothetical protein
VPARDSGSGGGVDSQRASDASSGLTLRDFDADSSSIKPCSGSSLRFPFGAHVAGRALIGITSLKATLTFSTLSSGGFPTHSGHIWRTDSNWWRTPATLARPASRKRL